MIGARKGSPRAIGYGDGEMYSARMRSRGAAHRYHQLSSTMATGWCWIAPAARSTTLKARSSSARSSSPARRRFWWTRPTTPLHGQGNPRAAGSGRPYDGAHDRYGERAHRAAGRTAVRFPRTCGAWSSGLRHRELCGFIARYWLERFARFAGRTRCRSEFRYREAPLDKGDLAIFVSQSGETADTLAALRYAKAQGDTRCPWST